MACRYNYIDKGGKNNLINTEFCECSFYPEADYVAPPPVKALKKGETPIKPNVTYLP
jgi:hypothetical protein